MSTPPFVASRSADASRSFAQDVADYLTRTPRQLPARYLYDDLGSALFEAICRLPWYPLSRAEQQILRSHAPDILGLVKPVAAIVELGPGSGEKLRTLVAAHPRRDLSVHLIDVSSSALRRSAAALTAYPSIQLVSHQDTYEDGLTKIAEQRQTGGRTLVLFLGSSVGNFDPADAVALLRRVRAAVRSGDALLLGADLVKPAEDLLLAYDDPLGVTAAFNRNLLVRINRELGGNFAVSQYAHRAMWSSAASRIEMHLVSAIAQSVHIHDAGLEIEFQPGATIWTESSYKYRRQDVSALLSEAGFNVVGEWSESGFLLTLATAP